MALEIGEEYVRNQLQRLADPAINFLSHARLFPLRTTGDGNCLMHAACLCLWAIEDSDRTLRTALAATMKSSWVECVRARWTREIIVGQAALPEEFRLSEKHLEGEWQLAVQLPHVNASDLQANGRPFGTGGSSLLAVHVYILSQMIRRPIIVYACDEAAAESGDSMAGIYVPSCWQPSQCVRSPLSMAFTPGHFTALVPMEGVTTHVALASKGGVPLRLRFEDPTLDWAAALAVWMDVERDDSGVLLARLPGTKSLKQTAEVSLVYACGAHERYSLVNAAH